jgi:cob(I)alamin adenosyltransferase
MLIIYTGNGKGKTTAAFGLALRAVGYNKKICILQFVKEESWPEGARKTIRTTDLKKSITIRALGSGFVGILGDTKPKRVHQNNATKALEIALETIKSNLYDIVILDELLGALHGKLISKKDVEKILSVGSKTSDLVLTGRNAPKWLTRQADLVTEMKEVKHPFQKGIQAKKAIDF